MEAVVLEEPRIRVADVAEFAVEAACRHEETIMLQLTPLDPRVRASLETALTEESKNPVLRPLLRRERPDLLPRFAGYYEHLTQLPRRTRRALQRQWRRSLPALALLLALGQAPALAATIAVDGTTCILVDAITAANTDTATGGCPPGSGADTLTLQNSSVHTLTSVNNGASVSPTGLPVISSEMTIEGHGSTIRRDSSAPVFRIIRMISTGDLTLKETTVSGGWR